MAKPICLVKISNTLLYPTTSTHPGDIQKSLDAKFDDYHVLVVPSALPLEELLELQVFYEKDFTQIQYDELKAIVQESINSKSDQE